METTFYDDHHHHHHHQSFTKENINMLKKRMTLDLESDRAAKKPKFSLLSSPDLNMLKLASPELEKLIISSNGMVTTTPTPTQFIFPRNVTEEQEMYARGFVDALAELHKANVPESAGIPIVYVSTTGSNVTTSSTSLTSTSMHGNNNANLVSLHNPGVTTVTVTSTLSPLTTFIKDEPQTVPNLGATPPLSPIDMETQEKIKLERKRQRNRIAASKCRRRKLERIARLEDKVKQLKGENSDLSNIASKLREQICQLKQQVMEHVNSGCQIMTQY